MNYLTVAETAELVRRHPVTVRKALEADELHGYQRVVGGRWSIDEDCARAWVEGRTCPHANVTNIADRRRTR